VGLVEETRQQEQLVVLLLLPRQRFHVGYLACLVTLLPAALLNSLVEAEEAVVALPVVLLLALEVAELELFALLQSN
jgi:hypothetical protein